MKEESARPGIVLQKVGAFLCPAGHCAPKGKANSAAKATLIIEKCDGLRTKTARFPAEGQGSGKEGDPWPPPSRQGPVECQAQARA